MSRLEISVPVGAPAALTWQLLTDWDRQGEWMLATTVRTVGPQRRGVGDRLEAFTGLVTPIGRIGFVDTMAVTDWQADRSVTVAHTGRVVRGSGTFQVLALTDTASRIVWREDLAIPGGRLGAALWSLTRPVSGWAVTRSLKLLARQVETVA
jgi:hypothetical protein